MVCKWINWASRHANQYFGPLDEKDPGTVHRSLTQLVTNLLSQNGIREKSLLLPIIASSIVRFVNRRNNLLSEQDLFEDGTLAPLVKGGAVKGRPRHNKCLVQVLGSGTMRSPKSFRGLSFRDKDDDRMDSMESMLFLLCKHDPSAIRGDSTAIAVLKHVQDYRQSHTAAELARFQDLESPVKSARKPSAAASKPSPAKPITDRILNAEQKRMIKKAKELDWSQEDAYDIPPSSLWTSEEECGCDSETYYNRLLVWYTKRNLARWLNTQAVDAVMLMSKSSDIDFLKIMYVMSGQSIELTEDQVIDLFSEGPNALEVAQTVASEKVAERAAQPEGNDDKDFIVEDESAAEDSTYEGENDGDDDELNEDSLSRDDRDTIEESTTVLTEPRKRTATVSFSPNTATNKRERKPAKQAPSTVMQEIDTSANNHKSASPAARSTAGTLAPSVFRTPITRQSTPFNLNSAEASKPPPSELSRARLTESGMLRDDNIRRAATTQPHAKAPTLSQISVTKESIRDEALPLGTLTFTKQVQMLKEGLPDKGKSFDDHNAKSINILLTISNSLHLICEDAIRDLQSGGGSGMTFISSFQEAATNLHHVAMNRAAELDLKPDRLKRKREVVRAKEAAPVRLILTKPKDTIDATKIFIHQSVFTKISFLQLDQVIRLMKWPRNSLLLLTSGFDLRDMVLSFSCDQHEKLLNYYRDDKKNAPSAERGIKAVANTIKRYEMGGWVSSLSKYNVNSYSEEQICLVWTTFEKYVIETADKKAYSEVEFNEKRRKVFDDRYTPSDDADGIENLSDDGEQKADGSDSNTGEHNVGADGGSENKAGDVAGEKNQGEGEEMC